MKIYFGKVNDTTDTNGYYEHNGDYYSGCVELGTNPGGLDDVLLMDGVGRQVPLFVENIPEICTALMECFDIAREIDVAKDLEAFVENTDAVGVTDSLGNVSY